MLRGESRFILWTAHTHTHTRWLKKFTVCSFQTRQLVQIQYLGSFPGLQKDELYVEKSVLR